MMEPSTPHSVHRKPRRWLRWLLLIALIAGGVMAWQSLPEKTKPAGKRSAPLISLAPATHDDLPLYLSGLGTVQAYNTVTVRTRIDGQLMALPFQEGQVVNAGDVLAKIDDRTFLAQYHQALANKAKSEAQLANARIDLARYKNLGDSISKQVYDTQLANVRQLEATVQSDAATVQNAQTQLSYATITSPITGRTGIRQVDVGNIIHTGDTNGIVTITQIEPISVMFSLPQQNLEAINNQLADNKKLIVEALASDNKTVIDTGALELVDNEIDPATGTIKLKATFPNAKHKLWPGGFTNVRLLLSVNENALVVPTVAIQHGPQGAYVFVYKADAEKAEASAEKPKVDGKDKANSGKKDGSGSVVLTPVTIGIAVDDDTQILSGLKLTDRVITDGMSKLQDKGRVKLVEPEKTKHETCNAKTTDDKATSADKPHHKADRPETATDAETPANPTLAAPQEPKNPKEKPNAPHAEAAPVTPVESAPLLEKPTPAVPRNGE